MNTLTQSELDGFTGTENYYRSFLNLKFTDGVKYMAEKAGAYWLIDAIASHQFNVNIQKNQRLQDFQVWTLDVSPGKTAVLSCREDSGYPAVINQKIPYTDFPMAKIQLWVENGVLILPSEH